MASIAPVNTGYIEIAGINPPPTARWHQPKFNLKAWRDLIFGKGPLWYRLLRWGQRNGR